MKLLAAYCLSAWFGGSLVAAGLNLQFLPGAEPLRVFGASAQKISLVVSNANNIRFDGRVHAQIFQASSATALFLGQVPWKRLQVLPRQAVLESAELDFPAAKAETRFLVQWLDDSNRVLGLTSVLVYPANLFQTFRSQLCETNFGVLDPDNELKPLLKARGVSFKDLGEMKLDDFCGKLAIIGPFASGAQVPDGLVNKIKTIAKKNVAVVWIQPPESPPQSRPLGWEREKIEPSFYCVQKKQAAVVVVQSGMVSDLAENPQSEVALIYFCGLALNPQPVSLPGLCSNLDP
jgi:hypothetical protein